MFYVGSITGASGAYYNDRTGASGIGTFDIPATAKALYLVPSASGVHFALSHATGITAFAGAGLHAGRVAQLEPNVINGPYRVIGNGANPVKVAIVHDQAGFVSCRVFLAPTS